MNYNFLNDPEILERFINRLTEFWVFIADRQNEVLEHYKSKNVTLNEKEDVRILGLGQLRTVTEQYAANAEIINLECWTLNNSIFFNQVKRRMGEEQFNNFSQGLNLKRDLNNHNKSLWFISFFSYAEHIMRVLHKGLGLTNGDSISKIFKALVELLPDKAQQDEYQTLFNIVIDIRNTIHNAGRYMPIAKNPRDGTFGYKTVQITFDVNKMTHNDACTDENFVILFEGLVTFLKDLVTLGKFVAINQCIKDPTADNKVSQSPTPDEEIK